MTENEEYELSFGERLSVMVNRICYTVLPILTAVFAILEMRIPTILCALAMCMFVMHELDEIKFGMVVLYHANKDKIDEIFPSGDD